MNAKAIKNTRECLDVLYYGIYRIRMLIKMHESIATYSRVLKHQDFWGCLQGNIIYSTIVTELYSMIDDNEIAKNLKNNFKDFFDKCRCLRNEVTEYHDIRHVFAHKTKDTLAGREINYQKILDLLIDLESYLEKTYELIFQHAYKPPTSPCKKSLPCLVELNYILQHDLKINESSISSDALGMVDATPN